MMKSDEVEAMLHLRALGWGLRRIAREFGCSKNTVKRYVAADGSMTYSRRAGGGKLEDQETWLKESFFQHGGNAEVVRQNLVREQGIDVSLRTVERAVAPFRRLLTAPPAAGCGHSARLAGHALATGPNSPGRRTSPAKVPHRRNTKTQERRTKRRSCPAKNKPPETVLPLHPD